MTKALTRPPWWAWLSLLGLEAPVASVLWAVAFARIFYMVREVFWTYQFLFVAVWCVVMGDRLIAVFRGAVPDEDPRLQFARRNVVWLTILVVVAVVCGLWIVLFQVGYGLMSFAWLPLMMSLLFLSSKSASFDGQVSQSLVFFCAAIAFAFGSTIPAYFYGIPNGIYGFFFYSPTWFLAAFTYLLLMFRKRWVCYACSREDEQSGLVFSMGLMVLLVFCFIEAWRINRFSEMWFFYALGFGCACLYLVDRFVARRLGGEECRVMAWVAITAPALFLWMLLPRV